MFLYAAVAPRTTRGYVDCCDGSMRALLLAAALSAFHGALAADSATPVAERRPGYGVVESITPVHAPPPADESSSAGSSAPASERAPARTTYLVRVRLDDGSVQIRQLKKPSVRVGRRVLITNAGEVLPE
jgi:hypothetical protein